MTLLDKKFEDFKDEFGIHFKGTTELDFVHCFLEEFQNEIEEECKKCKERKSPLYGIMMVLMMFFSTIGLLTLVKVILIISFYS